MKAGTTFQTSSGSQVHKPVLLNKKATRAALKKHKIIIEHYGISNAQVINYYTNGNETV